MPETVSRCPLCSHSEQTTFDQRQFREVQVSNQICRHCGLVYQSPRMTPSELEAFYASEYRRLYQGAEGPGQRDLAVQEARGAALLAYAAEQIQPPSRHLDIGCSSGALLAAFQERFGCQAVGVEPGDAYRAYASGRGFPVYPTLEGLQAAGEGRFDLVSLAHVLEHLPDPVGYLADLRQNQLQPEGWLLLEVPNLYAHDCFEVAHLVSFSAHTLAQTLYQAGFEVMNLQQHGRPRSVVLPLYLTVLARPGHPTKEAVQPERRVRLKRRAGLLRRRALERLVPGQAWLPI